MRSTRTGTSSPLLCLCCKKRHVVNVKNKGDKRDALGSLRNEVGKYALFKYRKNVETSNNW